MRTRILTCVLLPVLCLACDDEPERARPNGANGAVIGATGVTTDALNRAVARVSVCYRGNLGEFYEAVLDLSNTQGARARLFASQVACVNDAPDCDAANACLGLRFDDCVLAPPRCDGTVAVTCFEDDDRVLEERQDCADNPDGNTRCEPNLVQCVGPDACETSRCDGDRVIDCFDSVSYLTDCAQVGETCETVDDQPQCVPPERVACDGPCDGNIAIDCIGGAVRRTYDCALLGFICNNATGQRGPCVAAEPECEHGMSRCVGAVAEICIFGGWLAFDCVQAGGQCAVNDDEATCRPAD